ncbi:MAG: ABC transporter substrate-binding protein [Kiloniellales bacterium]
MLRTWTRRAFMALAAGALIGAAALGAQEARAQGTLIYGMPADHDILDPHATGGWVTYHVTYNIFESFVKEDLTEADVMTPRLVPGLATSWEVSDDGTVYTFHLRDGVEFHDGEPFDADAVMFNFERFWDKDSPNYYEKSAAFVSAYTQWIKAVEKIDDMTVKITLTQPNYEWLRTGLQSYGQPLMISPTSVEQYGNEGIALNPVGTGPFKFVEREQGVKTVLERNDDYWGRKAKLDRIIFRPLEDPATRVNALRTGEVNFIGVPPWDDVEDLKDEGFLLTTNDNVPNYVFIHLNFKHPILKDKKVRQALNMAIDKEGLVREIYAGTGRVEHGMLSPGTFAYDPDFRFYDYDPDKAKALLTEAGYPDGFAINWDIFQYGTGELVESWIQRDLKKIGIDVKIQKFEWIAYLRRWASGMTEDIAMNHIGWGMTYPSFIRIVASCKSFPPNGVNSGWYCNEEVDKLMDQAVTEKDETKARAIYQEINKLIMEDAAFVPLVDDLQPIFLAPSVKGFVNPPNDWYDFSTVWIEQ